MHIRRLKWKDGKVRIRGRRGCARSVAVGKSTTYATGYFSALHWIIYGNLCWKPWQKKVITLWKGVKETKQPWLHLLYVETTTSCLSLTLCGELGFCSVSVDIRTLAISIKLSCMTHSPSLPSCSFLLFVFPSVYPWWLILLWTMRCLSTYWYRALHWLTYSHAPACLGSLLIK